MEIRARSTPAQKAWSIIKIVLITMPMTALVLFVWIGQLVLFKTYFPEIEFTAEESLNVILILIFSLIGLPLAQRLNFRFLWHARHHPHTDLNRHNGTQFPPVPVVHNSWLIQALRGLFYGLAILSMLIIFAPLSHQRAMVQTVGIFSGRHSFWPFMQLLLFLALAISLGLIAFIMDRLRKRPNFQLRSADSKLRFELQESWLFAFATSYIMLCFFCFIFGMMVLRYLH